MSERFLEQQRTARFRCQGCGFFAHNLRMKRMHMRSYPSHLRWIRLRGAQR